MCRSFLNLTVKTALKSLDEVTEKKCWFLFMTQRVRNFLVVANFVYVVFMYEIFE